MSRTRITIDIHTDADHSDVLEAAQEAQEQIAETLAGKGAEDVSSTQDEVSVEEAEPWGWPRPSMVGDWSLIARTIEALEDMAAEMNTGRLSAFGLRVYGQAQELRRLVPGLAEWEEKHGQARHANHFHRPDKRVKP